MITSDVVMWALHSGTSSGCHPNDDFFYRFLKLCLNLIFLDRFAAKFNEGFLYLSTGILLFYKFSSVGLLFTLFL